MKNYILILTIFLIIDSIWLYLVAGPMFAPMIQKIQKEPMTTQLVPAVITYLLLGYGIYYFSRVNDPSLSDRQKVLNGALLGLITYGVFDFTNMAILKDYDLKVGLVDALWGSIVSGTTVFVYLQIKKVV